MPPFTEIQCENVCQTAWYKGMTTYIVVIYMIKGVGIVNEQYTHWMAIIKCIIPVVWHIHQCVTYGPSFKAAKTGDCRGDCQLVPVSSLDCPVNCFIWCHQLLVTLIRLHLATVWIMLMLCVLFTPTQRPLSYEGFTYGFCNQRVRHLSDDLLVFWGIASCCQLFYLLRVCIVLMPFSPAIFHA